MVSAWAAFTLALKRTLSTSTGAWAWSLKLVSRFAAEGQMTHQAFAEIQTAGRRHVSIELPADAELIGAWIDNVPVAQLELGQPS